MENVPDYYKDQLNLHKVIYDSSNLPEYLRDILGEQKSEEDLLVPKVKAWKYGIDDCLFTDEEIAEQERSVDTVNGEPFSMHYWAEEYDKQEREGRNSWLDAQPYGPGVSNPKQDAAIQSIKRRGYAGVYRGNRPSKVFTSVYHSLNSLNRGNAEDVVKVLKDILKKFKLDPSEFIEPTYKYKYKD